MDGFDEIFDKYNENDNNNEKYFYNRFNLSQWNANVIVTCRSKVLNDNDINTTLIGTNKNRNINSMTYLWPFAKRQMSDYIEKFANMKSKNNKKKENMDWTAKKYEETLNNYPNLQKMIEEPFLLQIILSVLPSLVQKYGIGSRISKAQVYEVFNDQWIDIHSQNIITKLSELRIQMNINKIKSTLNQYCLDLGFDMFYQGSQVAIESNFQYQNNNDSELENENKGNIMEEKTGKKIMNENSNALAEKTQDVWKKYFNGDSVAKYILRRVGDNKYQFLHKSCQEYYAAEKIIFDILSWKFTVDNQQFGQHSRQLLINLKLLNEEMGIIQFLANRIYDDNSTFANLKSKLFQLIESSKTNPKISIAAANAITILNIARVSMNNKNWDKINIPHAILDYAFLEGTSFKGATLDHVSFYKACLRSTNFTNASVSQVNFGEYGYLKGHSNAVTCVQFSPDGNIIVSGSYDKTIRLWNASSGTQIKSLKGHSDIIKSVQFSPDGNTIVSGSHDKTIRLWK
ncbi:hypothetical protein RFI_40391, partial [Reticulomyxa filosa]